MKRFIKHIVIFLLPIFAISFIIDSILDDAVASSYVEPGEFEVWNDIYNSKINSDILIYGSSKAWVQFSPQILSESLNKSVYNMGMDGSAFGLQYIRHKEILNYNSKPEYIILCLDAFSLEYDSDFYLYNQFIPYLNTSDSLYIYLKEYNWFDSYDNNLPLVRYTGEYKTLTYLFRSQPEPIRTHGYRANDYTWNDDLDNARKNKNKYTVQIDSSYNKLLNEYITECKVNDIKLIMVYPPEYIEGQKFISNKKVIINIYEQISEKYSIPFIDYSAHSICNNKSYFYNSMHLNKIGAELFSRDLADTLQKILKNN